MSGGLGRVIRGESRIDFVGRSKLWATISAIVIGGSLIALFTPGITLGLEFTGGTVLQVPVADGEDVTVEGVEESLGEFELEDLLVQLVESSGTTSIQVRSERIEPERLEDVRIRLAEIAGQEEDDGSPALGTVNVNDVGPSWGRSISQKALRALIVFLILVTIYISFRFEPKMAAGAIAALLHDLISTAGIYALTGLTVSPATVIALLTLMGFSLYDTVVVFDRVRENSNSLGVRESYGQLVNRSMNEVLIRSINTSISSILPVAGLLFVGVFLLNAETLKDLAVAMFIGTAVSIYSSIFVAAPILAALKEREPRFRALREKARTAPAPAVAPKSVERETPATPPATAPRNPATDRPIRPRRKKRRR